jgi:hypothetical protein
MTGEIIGSFESLPTDTIISCKRYLRNHVSIKHNYKFIHNNQELSLSCKLQPEILVLYTLETSSFMRIEYIRMINNTINAYVCIYNILTGDLLFKYLIPNNYNIVGYLFEQLVLYSSEYEKILLFDVYQNEYTYIITTEYKPLSFILLNKDTIILNELGRITLRNSISFEVIKVLSIYTNIPLYCIGITNNGKYAILLSESRNRIISCYDINNGTIMYMTSDYVSNSYKDFPLTIKYLLKKNSSSKRTAFIDVVTLNTLFYIKGQVLLYTISNKYDIIITLGFNESEFKIWNTKNTKTHICAISNNSICNLFFTSDDDLLILEYSNYTRKLFKVEDLINGKVKVISEYTNIPFTLGYKSQYTFLSDYKN